MINERPILFSAPMIEAIRAGKKTQTRRVVKPQPVGDNGTGRWAFTVSSTEKASVGTWDFSIVDDAGNTRTDRGWEQSLVEHLKCPYGHPGDKLWVRETWALVPRTAYARSEGVQQVLRPGDDHDAAVYRADWDRSAPGRWRPSIHMPRWASRITLEIVGVRVERLQSISNEDATAEGVIFGCDSRDWYAELWDEINAKRGHSWESDPYVWVVEFKEPIP